jgi:hypothetical protein
MSSLTSQAIEPGAIPGDPPSNGMPATAIKGPPQWGVLDASVPPSFVSIETVTLAAGTSLYQVFSNPPVGDPYPSWEVESWWCLDPIAPTESAWRGDFAVEVSWNGGQYAVQWILPAETYAWQGPTALQPGEYANGEPANGYYLPGGGIQIYVALNLMNVGMWNAGPSPWITDSVATVKAIAPAQPPAQNELGLTERLDELSKCLSAMAEEARQRRTNSVRLRFQADRVGLERDLLLRHLSKGDANSVRHIVQRLTAVGRKVPTYYPWSVNSTTVKALVEDIAVRADKLMRTSGR